MLRLTVLKLLHVFPAESVLRMLLRADNGLYYLQGQMATTYGEGVHVKHGDFVRLAGA